MTRMLLLVLICAVISSQELFAVTDSHKPKKNKNKITMALSLIWEGDHLLNPNIKAVKNLRKKMSDIPIIHFFSPAYLTKTDESLFVKKQKIKSLIEGRDTVGLYLTPWKSLVSESKVPFRKNPTFWGESHLAFNCEVDCGREVPVSAYSNDEIDILIKKSLTKFHELSLPKPNHFMASGWMGAKHVLAAAVANGFSHDYSGIPIELLKEKINRYPLFEWLSETWKNVNPVTQPEIKFTSRGAILEMYNNGGTVDYLNEKKIVENFKILAEKSSTSEKEIFYHLGFYLETSFKHSDRIEKAVNQIVEYARKNAINLEFYSPAPIGKLPVTSPVAH